MGDVGRRAPAQAEQIIAAYPGAGHMYRRFADPTSTSSPDHNGARYAVEHGLAASGSDAS